MEQHSISSPLMVLATIATCLGLCFLREITQELDCKSIDHLGNRLFCLSFHYLLQHWLPGCSICSLCKNIAPLSFNVTQIDKISRSYDLKSKMWLLRHNGRNQIESKVIIGNYDILNIEENIYYKSLMILCFFPDCCWRSNSWMMLYMLYVCCMLRHWSSSEDSSGWI